MSVLEDARRLTSTDPAATTDWCPFCDGHQHTKVCPWLAMPRIVAALEAADAALDWLNAVNIGDREARRTAADVLMAALRREATP